MRTIKIDFTDSTVGTLGRAGEHNNTEVVFSLTPELAKCDLITAEIGTANGEKIPVEGERDNENNTFTLLLTNQLTAEGVLALQLIGCVMQEGSDEPQIIAKSPVVSGVITPSINGIETEAKDKPSLLHRIWAKIEAWASKIHEHDNKKTLDALGCQALDTPITDGDFNFGINTEDWHRLKFGGDTILVTSDGAVVRNVETKEENGKKFFRLYFNRPGLIPSGSGDIPSFVDIPIDGTNEKLDFGFNGTELVLPSGGEGVAIPVVHTLPSEAADGDMCLYSPANTIELCDSGKRIYFDWEEFIKPVSEGEDTRFCVFNGETVHEPRFSIDAMRTPTVNDITIRWRDNDSEQHTIFEIFFENGELSYAGIEKGREVLAEYFSVDELPKYFDMPSFDNISVDDNNPNYGTAPCFYAPYRLMVYRGGEWQRVETLLDIPTGIDSYIPADKIELTTETATLEPNTHYSFGEVATLTLEFSEGDSAKVNEYMFSFTSGETATVLTLPSSVQWANELTVEANKRYEISVADNIGLWCAVDLAVSE